MGQIHRRGVPASRVPLGDITQYQEPLLYFRGQSLLHVQHQTREAERTKREFLPIWPLGKPGYPFDYNGLPDSPRPRPTHSFNDQRLTVSYYAHRNLANVEECLVFQTLRSMNNLQSLVLSQCNNQPFIFALNPEKNSSEAVLCPNLKKLILFRGSWGPANDLVDMAKGRALRGAKLSSVTIVSLGSTGTPVRETEILGLREHVTQVRCMVETVMFPFWDYLPDETGDMWG